MPRRREKLDNETNNLTGSLLNTSDAGTRRGMAAGFRSLPIHPLLFAAYPVLSLYSRNFGEVPLHDTARPFAAALVGTISIWLLAALAARNARKGALIASAAALAFFSIGHIANTLPEYLRFAVGPACVVALIFLACVTLKIPGAFMQGTAVVNSAAILVTIPSLVFIGAQIVARSGESEARLSIGASLLGRMGGSEHKATGKTRERKRLSAAEAANLPDIYYIILDAYGRADSLKAFYGFDNRPFIQELERRGFYIADHSRSNYAQTGYCLPAYLNMEYLNKLVPAHGPMDDDFETERRLIDDNAAAAFLRSRGYYYINIWTGTAVSRVDTADLVLASNSLAPAVSFEDEVFGMSAIGSAPHPGPTEFGKAGDYNRHRAFINTAFASLESVPKLRFPKFIFAHILAPHPPFVFQSDGAPVNPPYPYNEADASQLLQMHRIDREQYQEGYTGQLQYINRKVLEAVDAIQKNSRRQPVIIIQGDHGSRMNMDWVSQQKTDLREPFSILNAYYVPPAMRQKLYSDITPVNTFRILFDTLFDANYPLLPDRSYFATVDHPMEFTDVTELLPRDFIL